MLAPLPEKRSVLLSIQLYIFFLFWLQPILSKETHPHAQVPLVVALSFCQALLHRTERNGVVYVKSINPASANAVRIRQAIQVLTKILNDSTEDPEQVRAEQLSRKKKQVTI